MEINTGTTADADGGVDTILERFGTTFASCVFSTPEQVLLLFSL